MGGSLIFSKFLQNISQLLKCKLDWLYRYILSKLCLANE